MRLCVAQLLVCVSCLSIAVTKRVAAVSKGPVDWTLFQFGVLKVAFDKMPKDSARAEEEKPLIEAAVLKELNLLRRNASLRDEREYLCFISMEEILDEHVQVVKGGLSVVVQKLRTESPPFRINFYKTEQLRKWLQQKPYDLAVNRYFKDQDDVWVMRLIEADTQDVPLPNMNFSDVWQPHVDGGESSLTYLQQNREQARLTVPQVNEEFDFLLYRSVNMFGNRNEWRCIFEIARYNRQRPLHMIPFTQGRLLLAAEGKYRNTVWKVSDAGFRHAFNMARQGRYGERKYTITRAAAGEEDAVLFTLTLERQEFWYLGYFGDIRRNDSPEHEYFVAPHDVEGYRIFSAVTGEVKATIKRLPSRIQSGDYRIRVFGNADVVLMTLSAAALANEL